MPSSPGYTLVDQFDEDEFPDIPRAPAELLAALATVPDPRAAQGRRHPLPSILAIAACAVVAGAKSLVAIAEWAVAATPAALALIGVDGDPPCESTIRRTLQRLHADGLDTILGTWAALKDDTQGRRVIAIDGKSIRGAIGSSGRCRHLLAALTHGAGLVLGQVDVDAKTNEVPMLPRLLADINIVGAVITADALHCVRDHATYLVERHAHYLLTVKGNQPKLPPAVRRPALGGCSDLSPRPGQGPRPCGDPNHEGRHRRRRDSVSARFTGDADHPEEPPPQRQEMDNRNGLRGHRPRLRTRPTPPTRSVATRTLGDRKPPPLGTRRHLGRRPEPDPHSLRPTSDGHTTKPGDHPAPADRRDQHRSSHQTPSQRPLSPNHTTADLLRHTGNRECRGPG